MSSPSNIVFDAMVQAVINRADPDDPKMAHAIANDYINGMKWHMIVEWSNDIVRKDYPLCVKFDPDNYTFYLASTEDA